MNVYWTFALLIALVVLQSTVVPQIAAGLWYTHGLWSAGVHPDLPLIVVTAWSLLRGAEEGMLWALIAGVTMDLISGAPFGMSTLPLLIVAFAAGLSQRGIFRADAGPLDLVISIAVIPLATMFYQAAMLAWLKAFGWPVTWVEGISRIVLPAMLVNTLLMPGIYWLLRLISRRSELMT